jgi:uncharacterized membrane protein YfcA
MTFAEFLAWLVNSGGAIVVVSFIFERWNWYQAQPPDIKQYLFFGACVVVSVFGFLGLTYIPPEVIQQIAPYFGILYSTFLAIFVGTKFHQEDKKTINKK